MHGVIEALCKDHEKLRQDFDAKEMNAEKTSGKGRAGLQSFNSTGYAAIAPYSNLSREPIHGDLDLTPKQLEEMAGEFEDFGTQRPN